METIQSVNSFAVPNANVIVFASHNICPVLCACEQFYIQRLLVLPEQERNSLKYSHKRFFPQVSLGIQLLQASSLYLESTVTMKVQTDTA